MTLDKIKSRIPEQLYSILKRAGIDKLRPCQRKALKNGLLDGKNLLVCTPTASGKTLVAEIAALTSILRNKKKVIYIVPLKALAQEKFKDFKRLYGGVAKIALSIGDMDSTDPYLSKYDIIITVSEKLDSLIRHSAPWLSQVACVIIDEIHLLDSPNRGPTLEILITMLRRMLNLQLIGLSATIGNPKELASWLDANLVIDSWRPVKLHKGIMLESKLEFY